MTMMAKPGFRRDHAKRVLKIALQIRPDAQAPRLSNRFLAGGNTAEVR